MIISPLLSFPRKQKGLGNLPPAFGNCCCVMKKPGGGLSSTLGFRSCNLVQLSPKSNLYPGRRPKRKAVPKVKVKIGGNAAGYHGAYICQLSGVCQEIFLHGLILPGSGFRMDNPSGCPSGIQRPDLSRTHASLKLDTRPCSIWPCSAS